MYIHVHFFVTGGKQYKITQNDVIVVNSLPVDIGEKIKLEKVCCCHDFETAIMLYDIIITKYCMYYANYY